MTIERTAHGGVRLVHWRRVDEVGTVSETVHEWTSAEWCDCVVFVSASRADDVSRSVVLNEVERIHDGR